MAKNLRRQFVHQHSQNGNLLVSRLRKVRELQIPVSRLSFIGAILLALLAALPLTWGVSPLPFYPGYVSKDDLRSRVDFEWNDEAAAAKVIRDIESNHVRVYREDAKWTWLNDVLTPVVNLLEKASEVKNTKLLQAYADEEKIILTSEQSQVIVDGLLAEKEGFRLYRDVVEPMRSVLEERVFSRGVLSDERYGKEVGVGGEILILSPPDGRRRVSLGERNRQQPLSIAQVIPLLRDWFRYEIAVRPPMRQILSDLLGSRLRPTLVFDAQATNALLDEAKNEALEKISHFKVGQVIAARGQSLTPAKIACLHAENQAFLLHQGWEMILFRFVGKFLLLFSLTLGGLIILGMLRRDNPKVLFGMALGIILIALFAHVTNHAHFPVIRLLVPVGVLVGFGTLAWGRSCAMAALTVACGYLLILFEGQTGLCLAFLAGGSLYTYALPAVREKWGVPRLSLICGFLSLAVVVLWAVSSGEELMTLTRENWINKLFTGGHPLMRGLWLMLDWFVCGMIVLALLPLVESVYGRTTRIRLYELQDQEHPFLRQLLVEAPNTYHHCLIVGTLAEAGAAAIGADSLLARVGSYYHDIGKLMKPQYFSENETGVSRHDSLSPTMSTLIITSHVKDGLEMARDSRLPMAIQDMIAQHHGRSIVMYFYVRAQKQASEGEKVNKEAFRYPGPRPQTREAGVLMLADSVEAASRSLDNPTPTSIRKMVDEICMGRVLDGELSESGLNLSDIRKVTDAFVGILNSMFHGRVKYPKAKKELPRSR